MIGKSYVATPEPEWLGLHHFRSTGWVGCLLCCVELC